MKQLLFIIAMLFGTAILADAQVNPNHVYVNGYTRSNGTYVQPHYRTAPNYTINDNFSTYPNVNPYTGKVGTVMPSYSYTYTPSYNYFTPSNAYTTPSGYTPIPSSFYNSSFFRSGW